MTEGNPQSPRVVHPLPPRAGPVVDAASPVVEAQDAWAALPERHRPLITSDADGSERVTVGGMEILTRAPVPPGAGPSRTDPLARLAAMDAGGIDQALLYPTLGLSFSALDDPEAAVGLAVAYNDWLADYCSADPGRLFGVAMLPLQDPAAAAHELRRAVTDHGFVGGFVRPTVSRGRSLADRACDPVWDVAEELDVPIGVHGGGRRGAPAFGTDGSQAAILEAASEPFDTMLACAQLIGFGVLERHPALHIVFLGASGGWVPFWLARLDALLGTGGGLGPDLTLRPSEYFARQCMVSFDVHERTLPALAPFVGPERIVWGSPSPPRHAPDRHAPDRHAPDRHAPDRHATDPGALDALDALDATIASCPTAVQANVRGLNARRIYRLPSRRPAPAGVIDDYFAAVTAQDASMLRGLFASDATFDVDGERRSGTESIVSYYTERTFTFEDFRPAPGPLQEDGSRLTVDIDVHIGGADSTVRDTFEIEGEKIASLRVRGFADALRAIAPGREQHSSSS